MTQDARRSTIELMSDAFSDASALLSTEASLLRAEVNEKINHVVTAIGMMVGAAVFFIGALFLLLQTGVAVLVQWGLSTAVVSILMAVVSALIGLVMVFAARAAASPAHLKPERAMNQINRDAAMARDGKGLVADAQTTGAFEHEVEFLGPDVLVQGVGTPGRQPPQAGTEVLAAGPLQEVRVRYLHEIRFPPE